MKMERVVRSSFMEILFLIGLALVLSAAMGLDAPLIVATTRTYGLTDFHYTLYYIVPFTVIAGAASFLGGYSSDRHARKAVALVCLAAGCAGLAGVGLTYYCKWPFALASALRALSVAGFAGAVPPTWSMIVDLVQEKDRGSIFGLMGIAGVGGTGLGLLVSGTLASRGIFAPYLAIALAGLLMLAAGFFMPEPKRAAGEDQLRELIESGRLSYSAKIDPGSLSQLLRKPINLWMFGFVVLFTIPSSGLSVYFITFMMRNHGFNEFEATLYMMGVFAGELFGQVFFGRAGDLWHRKSVRGRPWTIVISLLLATPFLIAAFAFQFTGRDLAGLLVFSGLLAVGAFFMVGPNPLTLTGFCDFNLPEHRGTVLSLNYIGWIIARITGYPLCAYLAQTANMDYGKAFQLLMLVFIPSIIFMFPVLAMINKEIEGKKEMLRIRANAPQNDNATG